MAAARIDEELKNVESGSYSTESGKTVQCYLFPYKDARGEVRFVQLGVESFIEGNYHLRFVDTHGRSINAQPIKDEADNIFGKTSDGRFFVNCRGVDSAHPDQISSVVLPINETNSGICRVFETFPHFEENIVKRLDKATLTTHLDKPAVCTISPILLGNTLGATRTRETDEETAERTSDTSESLIEPNKIRVFSNTLSSGGVATTYFTPYKTEDGQTKFFEYDVITQNGQPPILNVKFQKPDGNVVTGTLQNIGTPENPTFWQERDGKTYLLAEIGSSFEEVELPLNSTNCQALDTFRNLLNQRRTMADNVNLFDISSNLDLFSESASRPAICASTRVTAPERAPLRDADRVNLHLSQEGVDYFFLPYNIPSDRVTAPWETRPPQPYLRVMQKNGKTYINMDGLDANNPTSTTTCEIFDASFQAIGGRNLLKMDLFYNGKERSVALPIPKDDNFYVLSDLQSLINGRAMPANNVDASHCPNIANFSYDSRLEIPTQLHALIYRNSGVDYFHLPYTSIVNGQTNVQYLRAMRFNGATYINLLGINALNPTSPTTCQVLGAKMATVGGNQIVALQVSHQGITQTLALPIQYENNQSIVNGINLLSGNRDLPAKAIESFDLPHVENFVFSPSMELERNTTTLSGNLLYAKDGVDYHFLEYKMPNGNPTHFRVMQKNGKTFINMLGLDASSPTTPTTCEILGASFKPMGERNVLALELSYQGAKHTLRLPIQEAGNEMVLSNLQTLLSNSPISSTSIDATKLPKIANFYYIPSMEIPNTPVREETEEPAPETPGLDGADRIIKPRGGQKGQELTKETVQIDEAIKIGTTNIAGLSQEIKLNESLGLEKSQKLTVYEEQKTKNKLLLSVTNQVSTTNPDGSTSTEDKKVALFLKETSISGAERISLYLSKETVDQLNAQNDGILPTGNEGEVVEVGSHTKIGGEVFYRYDVDKLQLSKDLNIQDVEIKGLGREVSVLFSALGVQAINSSSKQRAIVRNANTTKTPNDIGVSTDFIKDALASKNGCEISREEPVFSALMISVSNNMRNRRESQNEILFVRNGWQITKEQRESVASRLEDYGWTQGKPGSEFLNEVLENALKNENSWETRKENTAEQNALIDEVNNMIANTRRMNNIRSQTISMEIPDPKSTAKKEEDKKIELYSIPINLKTADGTKQRTFLNVKKQDGKVSLFFQTQNKTKNRIAYSAPKYEEIKSVFLEATNSSDIMSENANTALCFGFGSGEVGKSTLSLEVDFTDATNVSAINELKRIAKDKFRAPTQSAEADKSNFEVYDMHIDGSSADIKNQPDKKMNAENSFAVYNRNTEQVAVPFSLGDRVIAMSRTASEPSAEPVDEPVVTPPADTDDDSAPLPIPERIADPEREISSGISITDPAPAERPNPTIANPTVETPAQEENQQTQNAPPKPKKNEKPKRKDKSVDEKLRRGFFILAILSVIVSCIVPGAQVFAIAFFCGGVITEIQPIERIKRWWAKDAKSKEKTVEAKKTKEKTLIRQRVRTNEKLNQKIQEHNAVNTAIAKVNSNPKLSERQKAKKRAKLEEKRLILRGEIAELQGKQRLEESQLNNLYAQQDKRSQKQVVSRLEKEHALLTSQEQHSLEELQNQIAGMENNLVGINARESSAKNRENESMTTLQNAERKLTARENELTSDETKEKLNKIEEVSKKHDDLNKKVREKENARTEAEKALRELNEDEAEMRALAEISESELTEKQKKRLRQLREKHGMKTGIGLSTREIDAVISSAKSRSSSAREDVKNAEKELSDFEASDEFKNAENTLDEIENKQRERESAEREVTVARTAFDTAREEHINVQREQAQVKQTLERAKDELSALQQKTARQQNERQQVIDNESRVTEEAKRILESNKSRAKNPSINDLTINSDGSISYVPSGSTKTRGGVDALLREYHLPEDKNAQKEEDKSEESAKKARKKQMDAKTFSGRGGMSA